MSTDTDKVSSDAKRLLDSDGPHLRKWMQDDPLGFIEAVHGVATAALAQRATPEPRQTAAEPYPRPPQGGSGGTRSFARK